MKYLIAVFITLFLIPDISFGQFYPTRYRPAGQDWQEIKTDNFRVIYPAGHAGAAYRAVSILEREYPKVRDLTGGSLKNFPVILNGENDLSNGFVTPLNFRTEIEIPPPKGKSMNPKNSNWLELVLSHELVHASHYNVTTNSLTSLLGLFSPDLRRSVHSAVPLGVFEGLAVEYESHGSGTETGRGNYPWFTQHFSSSFASANPWSMGQLIHISSRTRPYNRHYIGGYTFIHWLQNRYGSDTMKTAVSRHFTWPVLGFGVALRRTTGYWPKTLYRQFREDLNEDAGGGQTTEINESTEVPDGNLPDEKKAAEGRQRISEDMSGLSGQISDENPQGRVLQLPVSPDGSEFRRPVWIDENTLILHGQFYNAPTGFYRYDLLENKLQLLLESRSVEDYLYHYSKEENALYYADYRVSLFYENTYKSDLFRYNLDDNHKVRLSNNQRLFAPSPGAPFFALQTDGYRNLLVSFDKETGATTPAAPLPLSYSVKEVSRHPSMDGLVAVIMSTGDIQALWVGEISDLPAVLVGKPDLSFENGSIFDISWHPTERKLLFSGDHSGTLDVYEYQPEEHILHQMTHSPYNAFEASYSPDGERIAFIYLKNGLYLPAVLTPGENNTEITLPSARPLSEFASRNRIENPSTFQQPDTDEFAEELQGEMIPVQPEPAYENSAASVPLEIEDVKEDPNVGTLVQQPYSPGLKWLKPRLIIPFIEHFSNNKYEFGIMMAGTDPLESRSYSLSLTALHEQPWFDLHYTSKQFFPGFSVSLFNQPSPVTLRSELRPKDQNRFLAAERGGTLHIPVSLIFEQNTRTTSLDFTPGYKVSQRRFYSLEQTVSALSNFKTRQTVLFKMNFNWKLRQFRRDMQPNAGMRMFVRTEADIVNNRFQFVHNGYLFNGNPGKRRGLYGGIFTYLAPLSNWNQTLGLGVRILSQTRISVYDTDNIGYDMFSSPVFPNADNLASFDTRYTIPFIYADNGGVTIPAYLDAIYAVLYSQTVGDLNQESFSDILSSSRTAVGAGIRVKMRLSNLALDLGIGFTYEPSRNQWKLVVGHF